LKIFNWTKDRVGTYLKGFSITNTPKISSCYDTPIQNGDRSNAEISCTYKGNLANSKILILMKLYTHVGERGKRF